MRRLAAVFATLVVAVAGSLVTASTPAAAYPVETLLASDSPYLATRVAEPTDTESVVVGMEWYPTVDGKVGGGQVCVDDGPVPLPVGIFLWDEDGTLLAQRAFSEDGGGSAPCFLNQGFYPQVPVKAGHHYVTGAWLMRGHYTYVPHGFDHEVSDVASGGHLVAPAASEAHVGNGLYSYPSTLCCSDTPMPTSTWENADYLVSPMFVPDAG